MKHIQLNSIVARSVKTQVVLAALLLNFSVFSSAQVSARDQAYLDSINAEAQDLEEVDNTADIQTPSEPAPAVDATHTNSANSSADKMDLFMQQVYSTLYSDPQTTQTNEAGYLKQLETEVQALDEPGTPSATQSTNSTPGTAEMTTLEEETAKVIRITEAQRKQMEIALENKIPGIYRLYQKLGNAQRNLVVQEYMQSERLSTASKTILKLYGGH